MTTEVTNYMTKNYLVQEYIAEWEVDNLSKLGTKSTRTPVFCPNPVADIKLCFELSYQTIKMSKKHREVSCFKLILLKLGGGDTTPSMKLKLHVDVNYSDGSVFQVYESPASISVENINAITCVDVTSEFYSSYAGRYEETAHKRNMTSDKLIVKFQTKLYGHLCTPSMYYQNLRALDNLKRFVKDFKSIYNPSIGSDIVFTVEKKCLPAHKSVLAAHSPVFMKMFEHDFLETKTNIIAITDYDSESFENFLKYLYSADIENKTWPIVKDLYTLADKYVVHALKQDCADIIASSVNMDQICDVLEMAYFYDDTDLKGIATDFAAHNFQELVSTEEWTTLVSSNPLIGYDVMRIYSMTLNASKN